jgi:hypothetical protein
LQIICRTAPGTGSTLVWAITIGGQTSSPSNATSSYAPPSVSDYGGPGAAGADTQGNQSVLVRGQNLGPAGTVPDVVTYGPNGTQFIATGCLVTTAHVALECSSAPGAGAGLHWRIVIGGQESVAATTAYAPPVISGLSGLGALDASTSGGQSVVISGTFFSFGAYLQVNYCSV